MKLIENMAASDIAILRDRAHILTKRSLLELSSQDVLLAQNKFLSKQLKALTETLSKLPTQIHPTQSLPFTVLQVAGCAICGGAHDSGCCVPVATYPLAGGRCGTHWCIFHGRKMRGVATNIYSRKTLEKSERCGLRTLIVKGSGVIFTHGEGISTPRVRHKGR